ncbi:lipoprotein insertase outer membrane protein LolB [Dokdonella sp.]|uniref:lipoprotein insertase outer membrane protein LolB n=1 Tax=Dokdonella sp. TaxID=2291710 RepID=UPI0031CB9C30|nr:lipoprotein insertase outer membrane protein LolB [Dokdonella sp.]
MNGAGLRAIAAGLAALLLAACAGPRVKPVLPTASLLAAQDAREAALRSKDASWQLEARLAVSDGRESGSGSLAWRQSGATFRFTVHAPVTGKTWVLAGDASHARLEGLPGGTVEGPDAAWLLERELGWHVPLAELSDWVRGMRAPGPAAITFRADGLPATIDQGGWHIEYRDYAQGHAPALPRRVYASRDSYSVRLAIRAWDMP